MRNSSRRLSSEIGDPFYTMELILVPVRTSFGLRKRGVKTYNVSSERKVDVDMLNVQSVLDR